MYYTFEEIKERLQALDPMDIVEILHIESSDLVNRFEDLIEERKDEVEDVLENWFSVPIEEELGWDYSE